jgi:hypothetical protein
MDVLVSTERFAAATATALDVQGREHLVVITKATWRIPEPGARPRPLPPMAVVPTDIYLGDPGDSPLLYGSDMARHKPRCDVVFNAHAHAPGDAAVTTLDVGWRIGSLSKVLRVVGPRRWRKTLHGVRLSAPEPFTRMPLHYGLAYGGTYHHRSEDGEQLAQCDVLETNPAGLGHASSRTLDQLVGQTAPNLEALDDPIRRAGGKHKPMAFSAVGRHWLPRRQYVGTYDDAWRRDVFPFLPRDFDEQHHQFAPEDQQMPYPKGGETVALVNLIQGRPQARFALPRMDQMRVRVMRKDHTVEEPLAVVDTLYFEPDELRFTAVWRASIPIRRRIHEFDAVTIGAIDSRWWKDRALGRLGASCKGCVDDEATQ